MQPQWELHQSVRSPQRCSLHKVLHNRHRRLRSRLRRLSVSSARHATGAQPTETATSYAHKTRLKTVSMLVASPSRLETHLRLKSLILPPMKLLLPLSLLTSAKISTSKRCSLPGWMTQASTTTICLKHTQRQWLAQTLQIGKAPGTLSSAV